MSSMHGKHSCIGRRSGIHGRVLAVCIGRFRRIFKTNHLSLFQKAKGEIKMAANNEEDLTMKTPPVVSQQEWEAAHKQPLVKEKAMMRSHRRAGRRAPPDALAGRGQKVRVRRTQGQGKPRSICLRGVAS